VSWSAPPRSVVRCWPWGRRPAGGGLGPQLANPLEYMYNGDTAIVAMQYSYLPSWLSFP
jgi:Predicted membrane protein